MDTLESNCNLEVNGTRMFSYHLLLVFTYPVKTNVSHSNMWSKYRLGLEFNVSYTKAGSFSLFVCLFVLMVVLNQWDGFRCRVKASGEARKKGVIK